MNRNSTWIILFAAMFFYGCAGKQVTKLDSFPLMYQEPPLSVLVLPPINNTTAADAKEFYSATIAEPLSELGFYVHSTQAIYDILREEGMFDTEFTSDIPPQRYREKFGTDALLYVTINKWDTNYYVVGGNVTVAMNLKLVSTNTGETLWTDEKEYVHDTTGSGDSGLLVQMIASAIQTASTDYVPVAKSANAILLKSTPYGRYHPMHSKDGQTHVVLGGTVSNR